MASFAQLVGFADVLEDALDLRAAISASDAAWVVGTNVEYGFWLEVGTRDMPAYPWLIPAARDVANSKADQLADEADSTDAFIAAIAHQIERQAKVNVTADGGGGRSPGTEGGHPKVQSGNLRGSIKAVKL